MATPKTSQLANLANQFPSMAQQGQQMQQSAASFAAQQAVAKQAATGQRASAADMGAQLYTAQAAAAREAQQKVQRGAMQVGQMELQRQGLEKQQILADRQIGLQQQVRNNEQLLTQLGTDVKSKLYDKAMQFQKDELGRTIWSQTQLMDFAAKKAQRWQDYRNTELQVAQVQKRRMTLLKTAQAKIQQSLQQEFAKSEAAADRDLQDRLTKAKAEIERKLKEAEAKAAEESAMWQMGGQLIGAAIGGIVTAATGGAAAPFMPAFVAAGGAIGTGVKPASQGYKPSQQDIRGMIRRR